MEDQEPVFFKTQNDFRDWLEEHHDNFQALSLGFYKKDSGLEGISYPQAVDEALCYGWIDGVRRTYDSNSYTTRFTPRKTRSIWSQVNIKRYGELLALGRVRPPGAAAFDARDPKLTNQYSFENDAAFSEADEQQFRENGGAWTYFSSQPPGYRKAATWWVISAKRPETREKRLATLIELSEQQKRLPQLVSPQRK